MTVFARNWAAALALFVFTTLAHAAGVSDLPWKYGPTKVQLGTQATLDVPDGYAFLDPAGTKRLNELMENPPDASDTYTLAPTDMAWTAFFDYDDVGYVKDDEKLNPDDILASAKQGTEESNKERRSRGWETLTLVGWQNKPLYDTQFKSLTWAFLARMDRTHDDVVNYNARILGRSGVMNVVLVSDPKVLAKAVDDFKGTLGGFAFTPGQSYTDFHPGDRVAEYGLAALITGGVAAVAAKKGLFAVIGTFLAAAWKFILVGLAAAGGAIKRLFTRKRP
ncbi:MULTISPECIES: DUF2167 domain-containing protein [unclassified Luteibacter]|uniref:DUF2167 domain-containing protein n=1 Tax=Luteibacter sp. PvP019 TaxID=3156436 RepID=UPI00339B7FC3